MSIQLSISGSSSGKEVARRRRKVLLTGLIAGAVGADALSLLAAAIAVEWLGTGHLNGVDAVRLVLATGPFYFMFCAALRGYQVRIVTRLPEAARTSLLSLLTAAMCAAVAAFAFDAGSRFFRLETAAMLAVAAMLFVAVRAVGFYLLVRIGVLIKPRTVVVSDYGFNSENLAEASWTAVFPEPPALVDLPALDALFSSLRDADRVVISLQDTTHSVQWARVMQLLGAEAEMVEPSLRHVVPIGVSEWRGSPTLVVSRGPLALHEAAIKRGFDIVVAVLALPVFLPVLVLLFVLVRLDSPGPALFRQERIGYRNRRYCCYKMRTMYHRSSDQQGVVSTQRADPRVTRLGAILRRTSLDELPQLLNVLRGDMSLVGPRPHAPGSTAEGALFWEIVPEYWGRHRMKPGITGLAQVLGHRGGTHSREDVEKRVAADLEYVNSWSLWTDIKILFKTVFVAAHRNAF